MEKIAIFTDSACDLTEAELKKYNIALLPLQIIYKDKSYRDRVEITPDQVYGRLDKEVPTTSLPKGEDIANMFETLIKEGYTHAIGIMISGGLSGTSQSVKLMAQEYSAITTFVYDTKTLSMGEGIQVLKAGNMVQEGKSYQEIVDFLPIHKKQIDTFYSVATLEYLIKGGRIGKVSGTIGELLNLKPIISVNEEGVYYTVVKARGAKQAFQKLIRILKDNLEKAQCNVWIMHGGAEEDAKNIIETIKDLPGIISLKTGQISPALGVHTGKGLIGLCIERISS